MFRDSYRSLGSAGGSSAPQTRSTTSGRVAEGSVSSAPHAPCQSHSEAGGTLPSASVTPVTPWKKAEGALSTLKKHTTTEKKKVVLETQKQETPRLGVEIE